MSIAPTIARKRLRPPRGLACARPTELCVSRGQPATGRSTKRGRRRSSRAHVRAARRGDCSARPGFQAQVWSPKDQRRSARPSVRSQRHGRGELRRKPLYASGTLRPRSDNAAAGSNRLASCSAAGWSARVRETPTNHRPFGATRSRCARMCSRGSAGCVSHPSLA